MDSAQHIDPAARIHPAALIDPGARVGARTRVWAFAHLADGARVGEDCNVCDHTFLEGQVRVGNRVTIKCGVYLWNGIVVEDDVFIGPAAVFTNDSNPRSRRHRGAFPVTRLCAGCSVGAGAVLLPGVTVGRYAMVGAGAIVTRDVPDQALVYGNPAQLAGWVCTCGNKIPQSAVGAKCACASAPHSHEASR